jgi:hypothetical protein
MPYTLWSRGRLLGDTDLGFVQVFSNVRMGWFRPSPLGDTLMSVLTGTGPALHRVGRLMRHPIRNATRAPVSDEDWPPPDIRSSTAYADLVSSVDELEAMQLQLRDPDGNVMEVEHIGVDDVEFKLALAAKRERRRLGVRREPWKEETEPGERYQIQVHFPGPQTVLAK